MPWQRNDPDFPVAVHGIMALITKCQVELPRRLQDDLADAPNGPRSLHTSRTVLAEPAAAIKFAHDFDVPAVLPAAFYRLAITDPGDNWTSGRTSADPPEVGSARWDCLDAPTFMRLMRGKDILTGEY